ncbi:unnamed protein product [Prunus brigantina]
MGKPDTARLLNEPTLNGPGRPGTNNLSSSPPSRCIYRVLERLRQGDDKVFTPHIVSIGLLHHGNECLKVMEVHNKSCWYGIVEHGLGEEEQVAALFNRTGKGVDIKSNCFVEVSKYIHSPWAIISLIVAGFLIILTVIPTMLYYFY